MPTDWLLSATGGRRRIQGRVGDADRHQRGRAGRHLRPGRVRRPGRLHRVGLVVHRSDVRPTRRPPPSRSARVTRRRARSPTPTSRPRSRWSRSSTRRRRAPGKVPADWTLTATPVAITGQGPVSGNGDPTSPGGVNAVTVFSGSYDLSETGPSRLHARHLGLCQGGVVTGAQVVVPPGGAVRCTITNTAVSPTLTLVKVVDNGTTGATTPATDVDPLGGRTDADQRGDRLARRHRRARPGRHLQPGRVRPDRLHGVGLGVHRGGVVDCLPRSRWPRARTPPARSPTRPSPPTAHARQAGRRGGGGRHGRRRPTGRSPRPVRRTISGPHRRRRPSPTATVPVGAYALVRERRAGRLHAVAVVVRRRHVRHEHGDARPGRPGDLHDRQHRRSCPTLTLVKVVDNGTTGATTPATAWTLSASGPVSISGATGLGRGDRRRRSRSASTRWPRPARPATPPRPGCARAAASSTPTSVTLTEGQSATCTITNTAIEPDAHAGQDRRQPLGRHRRADRLDPHRAPARRRSPAGPATRP